MTVTAGVLALQLISRWFEDGTAVRAVRDFCGATAGWISLMPIPRC